MAPLPLWLGELVQALDQAKIIISHSLVITVLMVGVLIVLVRPNLRVIFELLGAQAQVQALAVEYMGIWFLGLPFFAVAMVGSSLMRAMGDVPLTAVVTLGAALQIVLGPVFIFELLDFAGYGLAGAAMAFVLPRGPSVFLLRLLSASGIEFGFPQRDIGVD